MKRLLSALAGVVLSGSVAFGASLSLVTGPQDPSQLNATVNSLIQSINTTLAPAGAGTLGSGLRIPTVASAAVALTITPATSGGTVSIGPGAALGTVAGSDNLDFALQPAGTGYVRLNGASSQIANGTVLISAPGASGPVGSHTSIQEWFAVKNLSGTVRYIPAW